MPILGGARGWEGSQASLSRGLEALRYHTSRWKGGLREHYRGLAAAPGLSLGWEVRALVSSLCEWETELPLGLLASIGVGSRVGQVWAWKGVACTGLVQRSQEGRDQGNDMTIASEQLVLLD